MPWKVTDAMSQKISFVVRATAPGANLSRCAASMGSVGRRGTSELSGSQQCNGPRGAVAAAVAQSARTPAGVEAQVVALRRRSKKLQVLLEGEGSI